MIIIKPLFEKLAICKEVEELERAFLRVFHVLFEGLIEELLAEVVLASAAAFVRAGAAVMIVARDAARLDKAQADLSRDGGNVRAFAADHP